MPNTDKSIEIRPATREDAAAILDVTKRAFGLYKEALHTDTPLSALKETISDVAADIEKHTVLVAVSEGKIIGSIRSEVIGPKLAYFYRFSVDPEINNNGIGSELLSGALSECAQSGCTTVALHTNSKYFKLARYYYGKEFYVHSTAFDRGYIRALFIKELDPADPADLFPAFLK